MKKLLLIASALLAFSFFGCTPTTNPDTGKSDVVTSTPDDSTGGEETPTPEPIDDLEISLAKANWGWGYNSESENASDGSLLITLTGANGAGSFGYNPGADWSKYNTLVVELGDSTKWNGSTWAQTSIKDHEGKDAKALNKGFDVSKEAQTLEVDLTAGELVLTNINQISVQSEKVGTVIHVVKCYLTNK